MGLAHKTSPSIGRLEDGVLTGDREGRGSLIQNGIPGRVFFGTGRGGVLFQTLWGWGYHVAVVGAVVGSAWGRVELETEVWHG
eukprot:606967-Hanusia_phi.AAC.2